MNKLYEQFVNLLRQKFPVLNLKDVIKDIESAVEQFGINIKYSDMSHIKTDEDISGYVHVVGGKPEIVINGFQNKKHQRFTIAHELGHALIHWEWLPGKDLPDSLVEISYRKEQYLDDESERERQADCFAAEFLAPIGDVIDYLDKIRDQAPDKELQIGLIAQKFNISNPAAYYRWVEAQEV